MRVKNLLVLATLLTLFGWMLAAAGASKSFDGSGRPGHMRNAHCMAGGCDQNDDETDDESDDDGTEQTVCERTAERLGSACGFEVQEDWLIHLANCDNISDGVASQACTEDAHDIRDEELDFCDDQQEAREDTCELLDEDLYDPDPLVDPAIQFIDPDDVPDLHDPNPYVSIASGHTFVLRAGDEGEETIVVHVTEDSKEIQGVLCRVVVDVVLESEEEDGEVEYEPVEFTDDWFAQDDLSNVYYCGEISRNYEDGDLTDLDGSFRAGTDFAKAGLLTAAAPIPGDVHRQEYSLDEAEDVVQYTALAGAPTEEMGGENERFPCAEDGCLQTFDFSPLDPESTEAKFYKAGIGFVLAVGMEDGEVTGEREELICVGDSLAILSDAACELADPEALIDALCELAPAIFCAEDD